jgi:CheY-like chemotaxis protein
MKKIVIVEDNIWLGQSYARTLEADGYDVAVVKDAASAIDAIDETEPDAILLDILLAQTTGIALLHELQSHHDLSRIPVVVISSLAPDISLKQLAAYGVRSILDKATVTPASLSGDLRRALI